LVSDNHTSFLFLSGRFFFLILILIALFNINLLVGSVFIPFSELWNALAGDGGSAYEKIIYLFRIPKAITALLAGSALSVCGLLMQSLFRNPLAGPSVLGITSGSSIGVALVLLGSGYSASNYIINQIDIDLSFLIFIAASAGAAFIMAIILIIASKIQDNIVLLLVGIMIGNITLSVISIWQYFARPEQIQDFLFWTLGSLSGVSNEKLILMLVVVVSLVILVYLFSNQLNVMLTGKNYATSMGLNYKTNRFIIILFTSLLTGVVTGFCGPIGFVGIAVPHIARSVFNTSNHKILIPATVILGSIILLFCDLIAHLPGSQYILPINAVTALIGSPIVIWVIIRNKNIHKAF